MTVLLTGATSFIGSSVLSALKARGHEVRVLVRTDDKAAAIAAEGVSAVVGDITDLDLLSRLVHESDGVIHTASPGDASSAQVDADLVDVVTSRLQGTSKPYVHTGGVWVFGDGDDLTEEGAVHPPALTSWRVEVERTVRESGVRTTIVAPGIVYGHGKGIPALLVGPDNIRLVGDGSQHWTTVHVDDLADLYVKAFEAGARDEYYLGVSGHNPTVRDLGEAAAAATGAPVVEESADESRARLGEAFADALLLDQAAIGAHAKETLGWIPSRPSLADEFRSGAYTS
ncbi:NAD-dependent epimerase/dehydratase family protein [Frondihabitans cladoniiphilus]|uniref:NAD-dependent epimerase/dehydratase family protein n=1 Tax=Frondihabitans cladoniiphilus TaxID=715785 RepID=A0ABP8VT82_9MICO